MVATAVYLESGRKRVFACALDWPGWCRSGKAEEAALQTLAAYVPRYASVVELADLDAAGFRANAGDAFEVRERLAGNATTDFGAPAAFAAADAEPVTKEQAGRSTALLRACWAYFDRVVAAAPAGLRKGPRGGGRDRDKIAAHVLGAETAYARKVGVKLREPAIGDIGAIEAHRDAIAAVLEAPSDGTVPVPKGWPVRYAIRRLGWHVLDHAWEIEDRSG
ncbi:MAG TPA: hypothetical protein VLW50_03435 [Streptosporangiaceae bacterium]|nr:hypothetical protein [Streptosporangiaceae bacterium]